jgi:hypothetical protein
VTEREKFKSVALILVICLAVSRIAYLYRTPYGGTPDNAINVYLNDYTSSYQILEQINDPSYSSFTRYVVTVDCKYNWRGSNQGRANGLNIYFFDLKKSSKGWYVASANSGP